MIAYLKFLHNRQPIMALGIHAAVLVNLVIIFTNLFLRSPDGLRLVAIALAFLSLLAAALHHYTMYKMYRHAS